MHKTGRQVCFVAYPGTGPENFSGGNFLSPTSNSEELPSQSVPQELRFTSPVRQHQPRKGLHRHPSRSIEPADAALSLVSYSEKATMVCFI
ncbi:hypothetical protein BDP55DRAFT_16048 [Colletotrichum godetiae]|uniref:Uncharacterized protein n=1 Tax=Colletotrichum godetiae TaxID=1209918 RepID=A0AAJ0AZQ8_9PEZI|nr:uncharacterized protein BDP55DRAFT_16048 [Colletotrichum godetiae]KAK1701292.1 hypothetical protein BDP55DRAFT_16048 [Colletotrichum godetiae]